MRPETCAPTCTSVSPSCRASSRTDSRQRLHAAGGLHLLHYLTLLQHLTGEARRRWGLRRAAVRTDADDGRDEHHQHHHPAEPAPGTFGAELLLEIADRVAHDPGLRTVLGLIAHGQGAQGIALEATGGRQRPGAGALHPYFSRDLKGLSEATGEAKATRRRFVQALGVELS